MSKLSRLLRLLKLYDLETDPVRRFRLGACIMQIGAPTDG